MVFVVSRILSRGDFEPQRNALRFMRRVRWLGSVFAIVQFWLYVPPAGLRVPFDLHRTGLAFAGVLIAANLVSIAVEKRRSQSRRYLALGGLLCDAAVVGTVVWLFRFDTTSALWGLLIIPVLEAAVAAQMAGALSMWAGLVVFYVLREWDTANRFDYAVFEVPSVSFRMGIVLIVAATAGSLARSLTQEVHAQRAAKVESQQRARLLHGLALSSNALLEAQTRTDAHAVWTAIIEATIDVGFDGASIIVPGPSGDDSTVVCGQGLPDGYVGTTEPMRTGLAGDVWTRAETVTVEDYSNWAGVVPGMEGTSFGAAIAVPIRRGLAVEAVLVAGYRRVGPIPKPERECIELLAVHAGVALTNVAHSAERASYEARLTEMAYTDGLTSLPNREILLRRLDQLVSTPSGSGVAVLFIDIDRFKTVNDTLGHHGGDALLVELARRLVAAAEPHLVTRFGGDEFIVLVEHCADADVARDVARHLITSLSEPIVVDDHEIVPSISVGVRWAGPGESDAGVLLRDADTAMYLAKQRGRQRVEVFHPADMSAVPSLTMEGEMRRGLPAGEFHLHYQPVVSLRDGRIRGVEALLRWNHPTRGVVSPVDFIPVAEDSGFIVELGRWVLEEACRQAVAWRAGGLSLAVAVNVSVVQLQHAGLVETISATLAATGLSASNLVIEITESATVTDPDLMLARADRIRELGVRLAIDDFGQGTTSLRLIRRLAPDVLKIDKTLVDELLLDDDGQGDHAAIVRSMIHLAHDLGLVVTAEGIEEQRQLDVLHALGCDSAQGYLLGRPMPAQDVTAVIQAAQIVNTLSIPRTS